MGQKVPLLLVNSHNSIPSSPVIYSVFQVIICFFMVATVTFCFSVFALSHPRCQATQAAVYDEINKNILLSTS